ncbi:MAG: hypothetical protein AAAB20_00870 [Rhizobium sp.]
MPLGFEEIDVGAKLEATVDLFAFQPEGLWACASGVSRARV